MTEHGSWVGDNIDSINSLVAYAVTHFDSYLEL